ncbi:MAG: YitT family protein [Clostridiales bacterium]|nr:YitT family protein [Clostridiales bacterium]
MKRAYSEVSNFLFIFLGTLMTALSIGMFFDPNHMVIGGFTGLGMIIKNYTTQFWGFEVSLSTLNTILNLPLFVGAWILLGRKAVIRTIIATLLLSFMLSFENYMPTFTGDLLLVCIYGGVLMGFGAGLLFRGTATTGGTELVSAIIHKINHKFPVSKLMFAADGIIIALGLFTFGMEKTMYAVIAVFISSKCISLLLEGMNFSKAAMIISSQSGEITRAIQKEADRGVTALHGHGTFTGEDRDVLLCVFSQKEVSLIRQIVQSIDKKAFMVVYDVREVIGEGFDGEDN